MTQQYYQKQIFIPRVDEKNNFLGPVERWEAHEKGILHRAFTVAVFYQGKIICQHRKHPVFDDVFDFTASSHPQVTNGTKIQELEDAVLKTLQREWGMLPSDIKNMVKKGFAVYNDKDPKSKYREHEYCYLFTCDTEKEPEANLEVAYGFSLASLEELKNKTHSMNNKLSPWVKEFLKKGVI